MTFYASDISNSMLGPLVLPLFARLVMLFYNYKSKVAQYLTLGTLGTFILLVLSRTTFGFSAMSMLDLIFLGAALCLGVALLAKAQLKRR